MHEKKVKKKLTSVSFMYVCVAENAELLAFFTFFMHLPLKGDLIRDEDKDFEMMCYFLAQRT